MNARFKEITQKASYKDPWRYGKRCVIPAESFDEPCRETGRNIWWRFRRADGAPWGIAGVWNTWANKETGEVVESFTMLTVNADNHPLMSRMHKPDPKLPPDQHDKSCLVTIEFDDVGVWLHAPREVAASLARAPAVELFDAAPVQDGERDAFQGLDRAP